MLVEISIVIITYNEEKNIARCIDSVQGLSKDIVVVDSYSTDRTREICLEKGVHFLEHRFDGHIEQKNYAITQAKNLYVLSLDADEALTDELREAIQNIRYNWEFDAYSFNRLTNYCGKWIKHCGWYPDRKTRLWNTSKGRWGGENPHDMVIVDGDANLKHVNLDILHYSFYTEEEHLKQIDYFTDISSKAAFEKGKYSNGFIIFYKSKFKFFRDYVLMLGFLDGPSGYTVCKNSAYATALKYRKLRALNNNEA